MDPICTHPYPQQEMSKRLFQWLHTRCPKIISKCYKKTSKNKASQCTSLPPKIGEPSFHLARRGVSKIDFHCNENRLFTQATEHMHNQRGERPMYLDFGMDVVYGYVFMCLPHHGSKMGHRDQTSKEYIFYFSNLIISCTLLMQEDLKIFGCLLTIYG